MENWEWTTGRSADEISAYLAYALRILYNIGLPSEGVTTPGGFGAKARPELSTATLQAVRDVYKADIPHYFRDAVVQGPASVAPRVENASDLDGSDPRCVVSVVACTNDWTGGWDNTPPGGADRFITADLKAGRMVEVIERGDVAVMMSHWTGIYWDGQELGFKVLQEVVQRLHARFDNLVWMKLSEIARYSAARTLTRIDSAAGRVEFRAPFCLSCVHLQSAARKREHCPAIPHRRRRHAAVEARSAAARSISRHMVRHQRRTCDLSRPAARSSGSGGLSSGSCGNVRRSIGHPATRPRSWVTSRFCKTMCGGVAPPPLDGPPANPAPDEGPRRSRGRRLGLLGVSRPASSVAPWSARSSPPLTLAHLDRIALPEFLGLADAREIRPTSAIPKCR